MLSDLGFRITGNIALLSNNPKTIQEALNRLAIAVFRWNIFSASSKCMALLKDWQKLVPALISCGEQLEVFCSSKYFVNMITPMGDVSRGHITNLRSHDIRLSPNGRICCAIVRSVVYGCGSGPIRVEMPFGFLFSTTDISGALLGF